MTELARILVVDDTEANRYAVSRHLRAAGFTVWEATDGRRALERLAQELPDLMVADVRMPGMDGLELVRRVRADARTRHLAVLQVSASFTDPISQAQGLDSGADAYLTHPVEPLVLLASIRALLRARTAEREARAAEAAWRATFEAIGDGVCVIDSTGCIERWNAAFESVLGTADLKGHNLTDLVPALTVIGTAPYIALADGTPLHGTEITLEGKRARVSARPVPEEVGGPNRTVCVITDMTKQRAAEMRVQQAQRLEAAGQLAGGIAHEINNMMTVILGLTEFVSRSPDLAEGHRRDMGEIGKAANRGAGMARQLLAFTRRQMLQPRVLDINATLAGMGRLIGQLMGADCEVSLRLSPDAGLVYVDEGQLEQAILNLALNARDAMERGGKFTMSTGLERLGAEFAERYPGIDIRPGDYTRISVSDTGIGMDPETLERIFEPFFTTKPVGQGSGLGLATVYGIVKQSNGYIWAESGPTAGASFHIYLPQTTGQLGGASAEAARPVLRRGSETILVVDDEPMVRALARRSLEIYGYSVIEAEDGQDALQKVNSEAGGSIALVVADVVMPRMDGRELSERLRHSHPGLLVVYMSGHTGDELARRRVLDPTVPFIQKPFHPDELVSLVQERLDLRLRTPA